MVSDLDLAAGASAALGADMGKSLPEGWSRDDARCRVELCIQQLFERRAADYPDAVALACGKYTLTYGELNAHANRLAHHLIALGVCPDDTIGICLERGPALIIGLLAILKSGGAYLPLDPVHPPARLAQIVADAVPRLLLCDRTGRAALVDCEPTGSLLVVRLDEEKLNFDYPDTNPDPGSMGLTSSHVAYVVYTSGSSGIPKGVMVEHASVVNCLMALQEHIGVNANDRVLSLTTISFDIAALEVFLPLLSGATLVQPTESGTVDGRRLAAQLDELGVTIMQATPAMWQLLLSSGWRGRPQLKALCGGEALKSSLAAKLLVRVGALWNLYGPTEATIWSCSYRITSASEEHPAVEPIGRPIANTRIYLLNDQGEPVRVGAIGEMYIGGAGVARGYLRRPELTAERFLRDRFGPHSGGRLYRSGDLARYRPDGNLEFLGRYDSQVKLRGFRIELEEIEAHLIAHAAVCEAVVLAREDRPGERFLAAYLTLAPQTELAPAALAATLRAHLAARLPDYMVPSAFVRLSALPLMLNGKVDRRALPAPTADAYAHRAYEAPRGTIELALVALWKEILGVERISRHDNFFELGGSSLSAMRLLAGIWSYFQIQLDISDVFSCPTPMELTDVIDSHCRQVLPLGIGGYPLLSEDVSKKERSALAAYVGPLSLMQRWWVELERSVGQNRHPLVLISMSTAPNPPVWQRAIDETVRRHEALRTRFISDRTNGLVAVVDPPGRVVIVMHDYSGLSPEERQVKVAELLLRARVQPFEIIEGKLFRAMLVKLTEDSHLVLVGIHHAVTDGWSNDILKRELLELYAAYGEGSPSPLPEPPLQISDHSTWEGRVSARREIEGTSAYWDARLAGVSPMKLPADMIRIPRRTGHPEARAPLPFSADLVRKLRRFSRSQRVTLPVTLLTVYAIILSRWADREQIVIGNYMACRNTPGTEGIVGCFARNVPILLTIDWHMDVSAFVELVRRAYLDALTHAYPVSVDISQEKAIHKIVADFERRTDEEVAAIEFHGRHNYPAPINHELLVAFSEGPSSLAGSISYAADLYSSVRIAAVGDAFMATASAMAQTTSARVYDIVPSIVGLQ